MAPSLSSMHCKTLSTWLKHTTGPKPGGCPSQGTLWNRTLVSPNFILSRSTFLPQDLPLEHFPHDLPLLSHSLQAPLILSSSVSWKQSVWEAFLFTREQKCPKPGEHWCYRTFHRRPGWVLPPKCLPVVSCRPSTLLAGKKTQQHTTGVGQEHCLLIGTWRQWPATQSPTQTSLSTC
jgi:hypothetical protein